MTAEMSAQRFIIEVLLANLIDRLPENQRDNFIRDLLRVGYKTDHFHASDDEEAEMIADVAVQTQERLRRIVERACERAGIN